MLWYKGWLETRFRLVFVLFVIAFSNIMASYGSQHAAVQQPGSVQIRAVALFADFAVAMICIMLAGAGIATQPGLQAAKGLHGSTLFTLTMPVSRFRLLAVRAGLGWLEMVGAIAAICCLLWFLFPIIRKTATPEEMFRYWIVLSVCGSALYCVTVLLSTFLDDLWRVWGSLICYGALWWLANKIPAPRSVNIFLAMGDDSPILAHAMPWTAMACALGLAAALLFSALKVVQSREY
jgi:hypothetical protein